MPKGLDAYLNVVFIVMKQNDNIKFESKIKGNHNKVSQSGANTNRSEIEGSGNIVHQHGIQQVNGENSIPKVSWWTKTHVICVIITTLIAILGCFLGRKIF